MRGSTICKAASLWSLLWLSGPQWYLQNPHTLLMDMKICGWKYVACLMLQILWLRGEICIKTDLDQLLSDAIILASCFEGVNGHPTQIKTFPNEFTTNSCISAHFCLMDRCVCHSSCKQEFPAWVNLIYIRLEHIDSCLWQGLILVDTPLPFLWDAVLSILEPQAPPSLSPHEPPM